MRMVSQPDCSSSTVSTDKIHENSLLWSGTAACSGPDLQYCAYIRLLWKGKSYPAPGYAHHELKEVMFS